MTAKCGCDQKFRDEDSEASILDESECQYAKAKALNTELITAVNKFLGQFYIHTITGSLAFGEPAPTIDDLMEINAIIVKAQELK